MANTAPQVMLLKLCSPLDRVVSGYYDALQTRIEAKFRVLIQHNDTAIGKYLSPATPPAAILVVEGWPANRANSDLQSQLADYVKAGGTLIVAMFFPDWDEDSEHNALYQKIGLDWEVGSRHTSRVTLNPDLEPVFGPPLYATLESPYEVWAAHLKHVSSSAKVYTPTRSSIVENPGFPPKEIDLEQCSVAFARCDEGFVGFIGDPLHRKGSEKLLMAMLGKLSSPCEDPMQGQEQNIKIMARNGDQSLSEAQHSRDSITII